jgi:hypothetical protein
MSDDKGLKQGGKGNVTAIQCLPFYIYICNNFFKKRALRGPPWYFRIFVVPTLSRSATGAGAKAEAKPLPDDRQTGNPLGAKKGHASWNLLVLGVIRVEVKGTEHARFVVGLRNQQRWTFLSSSMVYIYIYIQIYGCSVTASDEYYKD